MIIDIINGKLQASKYSNRTTKTFKISASPEVMQRFEKFLAHLQYCAGVGHSTSIAMYIDGDGADSFQVVSPVIKNDKVEVRQANGVEYV